jgi:hypothetical protein
MDQRHKGGRTDLETIASRGRTPDGGLSEVIRHRIEADPHLSARKIAHSVGIATSIICHHRRYVLGVKCCHVRWIPDPLTVGQKVAREQVGVLAVTSVIMNTVPFWIPEFLVTRSCANKVAISSLTLSIIVLASRMSIRNHTRGRKWLQSLKTGKRMSDSLAGFG